MQLPTSLIEKAALDPKKDDTRPALSTVWFKKSETDEWRGDLVAVDGFILAVARDVGATREDATGPIGLEAIKAARKGGKRARRWIDLEKRPYLEIPDYRDNTEKSVFTEPEVSAYPDYESILNENPVDVDRQWPALIIDAERLYRLAQAICDPYNETLGIKIYTGKSRSRPIYVKPLKTPDGADSAEGLLMPMHAEHAANSLGPDPEMIFDELRTKIRKTFTNAVSKDMYEPNNENWEEDTVILTTKLLRDLADVLGLTPPERCPCCERYLRMDAEWPVRCLKCSLEWEDREAFVRDVARMRKRTYCPKCGNGLGMSYECSRCELAWAPKTLGQVKARLIEAKGKLPDDQYGEVYGDKTEEGTEGSKSSGVHDVEPGAEKSPGGDAYGDRKDGDVSVGAGPPQGIEPESANPGSSEGANPSAGGEDQATLAETEQGGSGGGDGRAQPRRRRRNHRHGPNAEQA
jgi:hypothetical protein